VSLRSDLIKQFLQSYFPGQSYQLTAISGDASFRSYFRVSLPQQSYVLMDAPWPQEDCGRFVLVQQSLQQAGLSVPDIVAQDLSHGFLLLSDLGDQLLQPLLTLQSLDQWYSQALALLTQVRQVTATAKGPLPAFDQSFLLRELMICPEWFLATHLKLSLTEQDWLVWQHSFELLIQSALEQPQVGMHRDFHSRNLMPQPNGQLALIDFQDMVIGPISYDLVSLLKDCYIKWPRATVLPFVEAFYLQLQASSQLSVDVSLTQFIRWFDLIGLQRHIKVLGIFCRLYHRDQKAGYMADLPRVLAYVLESCGLYAEFQPLAHWLEQHVVPKLKPEY